MHGYPVGLKPMWLNSNWEEAMRAFMGVLLILFCASGRTAQGRQDPRTEEKRVKGILYEVWVYDSAMDFIHAQGHWIREVYLPEVGIAFNGGGTGFNVFPSGKDRYSEMPRVSFGKIPDYPAKKIREIELTQKDADLMMETLRLQEKAKATAESYLSSK